MELKELETFLRISELSNFTKAAESLNYTQSNVSAQIQKIEKELQCQLFDRIGHKVTLTKKGNELIPYAKQILSLTKTAKQQLTNTDNGKIVLAASESLCIYKLPQLFQHFQEEYPNIEIYLQMVDSNHYEDLFTTTDIDFAYVLDSPITNPIFKHYHSKQVPVGLFTVPNHPLASLDSITLPQLENERFILTKPECCYRKQFEQLMAGIPYTLTLETSSMQAIKEMTLSGLGICLLPIMAVERELQTNQFVQLPINLNINIFSQLITHKDKWISPEATDFLKIVEQIVH